jgi:hypothetical protein
MATKSQAKDKFANIAYLTVTESAAGTLTFEQLQMATMMMDAKYAVLIHRAEFYFGAYSSLNSTGDKVTFGLTVTDRVTDLADLSQPEILFFNVTERLDFGTAANGNLLVKPSQVDFTSLPGGGLLVPADRLYLGIQSSGAAAAMQVKMRLYYTVMGVSVEDYWDLVEARRIMTT